MKNPPLKISHFEKSPVKNSPMSEKSPLEKSPFEKTPTLKNPPLIKEWNVYDRFAQDLARTTKMAKAYHGLGEFYGVFFNSCNFFHARFFNGAVFQRGIFQRGRFFKVVDLSTWALFQRGTFSYKPNLFKFLTV